MKFSIIIPVYKVELYLRQCINSVLNQSYKDFELILVDDGSPDNCPVICDEYASRDIRVKVIHKSNGGLSDARNAGLDIAKGEYVLFLDSDDWWDDVLALEKINLKIKDTDADLIIIGMKKFFMQKKCFSDERIPQKCDKIKFILSHAQVLQKYMQSNIFVACACDKVLRRTIIEQDHQRFVKGQYSEDIEWCCKLLKKELCIEVLEEVFYVYRQQVSTSITANVGINNIQSIVEIIDRYAIQRSSVPLFHFLANQYVLLMANYMRLPKEDQQTIAHKVKSFWWLLIYNWYPYVKLVSRIKFLGFTLTTKVLRLYYLYQYNWKK